MRGDIVTGVPLLDIRLFRPADQGAVVALWEACALLRPWNDPVSDITLCLNTASSALFVAVAAGENGAHGLWATIMCGSDGHRGWLYYLAVDPGRRREGIARSMVAHAENWLAGQGIRKVELMIRPENDAVRDFYERVGYEVEPRLVMSRWLEGDGGRR
jgi:ribosomal protein S18 acetylase RimI-like enzyme